MDRFRADLRELDKINIAKLAKPLAAASARKRLTDPEANVVTSVASFASALGLPVGDLVKELARISKSPPAITVLPPKTVKLAFPGSLSTLTFAIGGNAEAFGIFGATFQTGVYASNSPEFGIFTSVGTGVFTNVGVSAGLALTVVVGPPSAFGGIATGIACDVNIPGFANVVGAGGMMLFSAAPAFNFLGWSFSLSAGVSALPVTFSVQVSATSLRPILK
jgi:hypothetical protein